LLALYGLALLGYFTATLATYFMGRNAGYEKAKIASSKQIQNLHQEKVALREESQVLEEKGSQ